VNKNTREAHETLVSTYGEQALSISQRKKWFQKFRSGDCELDNKKRENAPKKFEDAELLLKPSETVDTAQYQQQLNNLRDVLDEKRPIWRKTANKADFFPR
jgi:histone-lysine N-methyltransferase SETMAR